MKKLENYYNEKQAIRFAYENCNGNDGIREECRKRMNALYERIDAEGQDFAQIFRLYDESKERGNDLIDINEVVWDDNAPALVESFRKYGIERFAFSSTYSGTVQTAWLFVKNGCRLEGMEEINSRYTDIRTDEREKVPAYIFKVG